MIDRCNPPYDIETHDIVRVVNLPGCPKANTMNHCHVEHVGGAFAGLVCCNSLVALTPEEKLHVRRVMTGGKYRRPSKKFNLNIVGDSQTITSGEQIV
jgi:hypothetical protein